MLKKIKIFIASSIDELKRDRIEIGDFFQELNEIYLDYGVHFSLIKCENLDTAISLDGKQSEYDDEIRDSDLSFFLFFKKVGEYTKHEFEVALEALRENNKPKIVTYFKTVENSNDITDEIKAFMHMLDADLHHYYNTYNHIDTLRLGMFMQIKRMHLEDPDVRLHNGKICVGNNVIADSRNIPMFSKNTKLNDYRKNLAEVSREYGEMKKKYIADSGNEKLYLQYSSLSSRKDGMEKKLRDAEKSVLDLAEKMALDMADKKVSKRQVEGYRLLQKGDYTGALKILDTEKILADIAVNEALEDSAKFLLNTNVNELVQRIDVLKAQGLTGKTVTEVKNIYVKIYNLIDKNNLDPKPLYDYMDFSLTHNHLANALRAVQKMKYLYSNPDAEITTEDMASLCTAAGKAYLAVADYDKAEAEFKEALRLFTSINEDGKQNEKISVAHHSLAELYVDTDNFDKAEQHMLSSRNINPERDLSNEWDALQYVAEYNLAAQIYSKTNKYQLAVAEYKKALEIALELYKKNEKKHAQTLAAVYTSLGALCFKINYYDDAEKVFSAAINLLTPLEKLNPDRYAPALASACTHYCNLLINLKRNKEAEAMLKTALNIREHLYAKYPAAYKQVLSGDYSTATTFYLSTRDYNKAEKYNKKSMKLAEELYAENPEAYKVDYAAACSINNMVTSAISAMRLEKTPTPESTQQAAENSLETLKTLFKDDPETYGHQLSSAYQSLGISSFQSENYQQAISHFKNAMNTIFALDKKNSDINLPYVIPNLIYMANSHVKLNQFKEAEKQFKDAEAGLEIIIRQHPEQFKPMRAQCKLSFTDMYILSGDIKNAFLKCGEALNCYDELFKENPSAYEYEFALVYERVTTIYFMGGDIKSAIHSCDQTIKLLEMFNARNGNKYTEELARMKQTMDTLRQMS